MKSVTLKVRARTIMCVLGTILGVLLFSLALFAQGSFGRILGTVTDPSGAVIAGATVSIIDTQRGLARTLTTDQAGEYNAPNLIPGTYTVRVEAPGFQTLRPQNVVLEVGKEVRVDLTPRPGRTNPVRHHHRSAPAGGCRERHPGRHTQQRGHQRSALEWPQLPEC